MAHAPLRRLTQMLAAKEEATPGTAIALLAADAVDRVTNLQFEYLTQKTLTDGPGGLKNPGQYGVRSARLSFSLGLDAGIDVPAGDNIPPRCAALYLAACGLGPTGVVGTYKRDRKPAVDAASTAITLTLGWFMDGLYHTLYGAAGDATFHFAAGEVVMVDFDFKGKTLAPTSVALLAPTYVNPTLLRFGNASFSLAAWAPRLSKLDLALGNKVEMLEDENAADGSGIACFYVDDDETIGAIDPEAHLTGDHDAYALWEAGTRVAAAFSATAGTASAAFTMSAAEYVNLKIGARRSLATWDMGFQDMARDLTILFTPAV